VDVEIHIFLTSALVGGEWSGSHPGRFTPGERAPGTHSIGGWVNPRDSLDDMEKWKLLTLSGLELRPLGCPARSQSLYRLRCPGSLLLLLLFIRFKVIRTFISTPLFEVKKDTELKYYIKCLKLSLILFLSLHFQIARKTSGRYITYHVQVEYKGTNLKIRARC
jgi:hypothetical protein